MPANSAGVVGGGGTLLAGGDAVLQVDVLHLQDHLVHVELLTRLHLTEDRPHGVGLLAEAVRSHAIDLAAVTSTLGIDRLGIDAGQLEELRVGDQHVAGGMNRNAGDLGGDPVQDVAIGMLTLGQGILVVGNTHDHAIGADAVLLAEGAHGLDDLIEALAVLELSGHDILVGTGDMAVRVDDAGA